MMPFLRINANEENPVLHAAPDTSSPHSLQDRLSSALTAQGPVTVMIHGYKFAPNAQENCPHSHIFSLGATSRCRRAVSWPRRLGYGRQMDRGGVGIAFGWNARGGIRAARAQADVSGRALASLIGQIRALDPQRQVNILAHSLGGHVALSAMQWLAPFDVHRAILMNPAVYQGQAAAALQTSAGKTCEIYNVTSRENALYDVMLETFAPSKIRRDRAMGRGFEAANVVTLKLDQPHVLSGLSELGFRVAPPSRRICHWSTYLRPGIFPLYRALFSAESGLNFAMLRDISRPPARPEKTARLANNLRWPLSPV